MRPKGSALKIRDRGNGGCSLYSCSSHYPYSNHHFGNSLGVKAQDIPGLGSRVGNFNPVWGYRKRKGAMAGTGNALYGKPGAN